MFATNRRELFYTIQYLADHVLISLYAQRTNLSWLQHRLDKDEQVEYGTFSVTRTIGYWLQQSWTGTTQNRSRERSAGVRRRACLSNMMSEIAFIYGVGLGRAEPNARGYILYTCVYGQATYL